MEYDWRQDTDFVPAFKVIQYWEGGYQCDPRDSGNWTGGEVGRGELKGTICGISAASYPHLDIKNLTEDDIGSIYYPDWWLKHRYGELKAQSVQQKVFNLSVLNPTEGTRSLQRGSQSCGIDVDDDGVMGPATIEAANQCDPDQLIVAIRGIFAQWCRMVAAHYTARTGKPDPYLAGWLRRSKA
jgi:lysozyme family protein